MITHHNTPISAIFVTDCYIQALLVDKGNIFSFKQVSWIRGGAGDGGKGHKIYIAAISCDVLYRTGKRPWPLIPA